MSLKLAVKTRVVVNSKEYHGVEEMPPEVRSAYEKAMGPGGGPASAIIFNGRQYDKPESMPPETRRLYEAAVASLTRGTPVSPAVPTEAPDGAIEPAGGTRWTLAALIGGAGLLILWSLLRGRG
jgi:hypothetical protein